MQFKKPLIYSLFFLCAFQLSAQHIAYDLSYKKDIPLVLGGIALNLTTYFLNKRDTPLTETQLQNFDPNSIWKFDRGATNQWSPKAALASDVFMITGIISPLAYWATRNLETNIIPRQFILSHCLLMPV